MVRVILFLVAVAVVFSLGLALHMLLWTAMLLLLFWFVAFIAVPNRGRRHSYHR